MVATTEGEFARKRRMMRGIFDEVVRDGMLLPRGYRPAYAFEIASHRGLRYASPVLHLVALGSNLALLGAAPVYAFTLAAQLLLLVAAALAGAMPIRPFRLARYYVLVTASIAAGFWDRLRHGTPGRLGEGRGNEVTDREAQRSGLPRAVDLAIAAAAPGARLAAPGRWRRSRSSSTRAAR